jgi:hypothetical protein
LDLAFLLVLLLGRGYAPFFGLYDVFMLPFGHRCIKGILFLKRIGWFIWVFFRLAGFGWVGSAFLLVSSVGLAGRQDRTCFSLKQMDE